MSDYDKPLQTAMQRVARIPAETSALYNTLDTAGASLGEILGGLATRAHALGNKDVAFQVTGMRGMALDVHSATQRIAPEASSRPTLRFGAKAPTYEH